MMHSLKFSTSQIITIILYNVRIGHNQVEIYYWRSTMPVLPSPNDKSTGSWQSVLGWYLKAVLVQYYQPVLVIVTSTAPVVNQ